MPQHEGKGHLLCFCIFYFQPAIKPAKMHIRAHVMYQINVEFHELSIGIGVDVPQCPEHGEQVLDISYAPLCTMLVYFILNM